MVAAAKKKAASKKKGSRSAQKQDNAALAKALGIKEPGAFTMPETNSEYQALLVERFNYYASLGDDTSAKMFLIEYAKGIRSDDEIKLLQGVGPMDMVPTMGYLARMSSNGCELAQKDVERLNKYIEDLVQRTRKTSKDESEEKKEETKQAAPKKPKEKPVEKDMPAAVNFLTLVEQEIDRYFKAKKGQLDDKIAKGFQPNNKEIDYIHAELDVMMDRLVLGVEQNGEVDRDLCDMKPTNVRKIREFIQKMRDSFVKSATKSVKKAKPKKKIDVRKQVASMKMAKEGDGMKSIDPTKIVGAKACVVYDTDRRDLMVIEAQEGGLAVQGTTIKNAAKVRRKKVREQYVKDLAQAATSMNSLTKFFDSLAGKETESTSRMNNNRMVLAIK